jgi:hypothetical protein
VSNYLSRIKHGRTGQTFFNYINQRAFQFNDELAGLYPNNPNILDQRPCALSDYNNGATLIRAGAVHTHLFHRICKTARPMETPLCRMCFYSYTSRSFVTTAKRLYIQNEGLSEIFRETS